MNITKKIDFTYQALEQIDKIILENRPKKYFRVSVKGGGCSGFKYNFTFDDEISDAIKAMTKSDDEDYFTHCLDQQGRS